MLRKSILVTSVCVLCVLVAVMMLVGGCGTGTPMATEVFPLPTSTISATTSKSTSTSSSYRGTTACGYPRGVIVSPPFYPGMRDKMVEKVSDLVSKHSPDFPKSGWKCTDCPTNTTSGTLEDVTGNWTITVSDWSMVIINQATGFRWQGTVTWTYDEAAAYCNPVASESSVTLASPNYTPSPRPTPFGHQDSVNSVAFSPDGKILASGSRDTSVILWNVETRQMIGSSFKKHMSAVNSVAFSPDGKILASASEDKTIILWDVNTRQMIGQPLTGHKASINRVTFSPDGKTLASGSWDETVILWDVSTQRIIGKPLPGNSYVWSVVFSPDGKILASGSDVIILWEVATQKPVKTLSTGNKQTVYDVAFSPGGKVLVSTGHPILLWNTLTYEPVGQLSDDHSVATNLAFSPDGNLLASGDSANTIFLWNTETRQRISPSLIGHTGWVRSIAFSPDGKILASCGDDKKINFWDVSSPKSFGQILWSVSPMLTPTR